MTLGHEEKPLSGVVGLLFSVGGRRMPKGALGLATKSLAFGIAAFVFYAAAATILDPIELTSIFTALMLALVFLVIGATPEGVTDRVPVPDLLLSVTALCAGAYYAVNADTIIIRISLLDPLTAWDIAAGSALCLLTLEATRRAVGLALTIIVATMMIYNLWGDQLSGALAHGTISYEHFLDQTAFTINGLFGAPIRVAATYAFLFVTFGTFLERCGGGDFFFNLAAVLSGRSVGGPAKVAVVSSAMYGTISGSPTSDVVTTGSVTIPMMRRLGYSGSLAGGIEVAASTSGGILPPIMGSAAFIMVEVTGIPYAQIVQAAILPAFLYLLGVFVVVDLLSRKLNLRSMNSEDVPSLMSTLRNGSRFLIPIVVLVVALFLGYSVNYVAIFGIISVLAVAVLRRSGRLGVKDAFDMLVLATIRMVPVAAACAAAGLVVGGISMTGLSGKVALLIYTIAGDGLLLSLVISAVICILLGMGMPTPSAYIMSAVLAAPILIGLGLPEMSAHFFLLFFAVLSALTPPVAVAAYAASSLAEANPITIAAKAVLVAAPAFFIPFAFAFHPELLGDGSATEVFVAACSSTIGVLAIAVASAGYLGVILTIPCRLVLLGAGIAIFVQELAIVLTGFVLLAGVGVWLFWRLSKRNVEVS
jgi:TRAP transporter 4TM/12TM fusion protein